MSIKENYLEIGKYKYCNFFFINNTEEVLLRRISKQDKYIICEYSVPSYLFQKTNSGDFLNEISYLILSLEEINFKKFEMDQVEKERRELDIKFLKFKDRYKKNVEFNVNKKIIFDRISIHNESLEEIKQLYFELIECPSNYQEVRNENFLVTDKFQLLSNKINQFIKNSGNNQGIKHELNRLILDSYSSRKILLNFINEYKYFLSERPKLLLQYNQLKNEFDNLKESYNFNSTIRVQYLN